MKKFVGLAVLMAAAGPSIAEAPEACFAAAWEPFVVSVPCTAGGEPCVRRATLSVAGAGGNPGCTVRIKEFPGGTVRAASWVEIHGDPVLMIHVADSESGPAIKYSLRPELDCTYTASWHQAGAN